MQATYKSLLKPAKPARASRTDEGRAPTATAVRAAKPGPSAVRTIPLVEAAPKERTSARVGRVLVLLRSGSAAERLLAAREMGDIAFVEGSKIPEAVVPLTVTLKSDPDAAVRQEAAWSLWKIGDARAHRALIRALVGDPSTRVREKAARALGLMGVRDAGAIMIDLLALGKHIPAKLRAALVASLGFLGEEEALPLLLDATEDTEPAVRCEAVRALGRYLVDFPGPTVDRVFRRIEKYLRPRGESLPEIRQAAIKALRLSADERACIAVARALAGDPDPATREAAAEALVIWDSARSEAALVAALEDDVWRVRKSAARTLARFILRYRVYDSQAVCEALARIERMFPSFSQERSLAAEAKASL